MRGLLQIACIVMGLAWDLAVSADLSWTSNCVTITSVGNYLGYSKQFYLSVSQPLPGCNGDISGVTGAIPFTVGKNGITDSNIASLLDTALTAYSTGHKVTLGYDKSTAQCYGVIILLGPCP
jgi:hypothetical protein